MAVLTIIYASTSGHTEYVIDTLIAYLGKKAPKVTVEKQRAELANPEDLLRGDILLLASGTWNTGSVEGQLNPHMYSLLLDRAATVDLHKKKVLLIGLGDERYHFTAAALTHLQTYVEAHNGEVIDPMLRIVNEPYDQEKVVTDWATKILPFLKPIS